MHKRKRKSKQQEERREESTGDETTTDSNTETIVQPSALHSQPSDDILPTTEAVVDDDDEEQAQESAAPVISKRCRLVTAFRDREEDAISQCLQNHPEIYNKEHVIYADKYHKEALCVQIAKELRLDVNDVKVSKNKSGQAPASYTPRQKWVYDRMSFICCHIRRKGESRTAGLDVSTSRVHNNSICSNTDVESLDTSGRQELPMMLTPYEG